MTRMYTYIRIDPDCYLDAEKFILELKDKGFNAKRNRIFIEQVKAKTSIKLRHKFMAILIYALDENDILIVKSLNCLGNSIYEIINIINKLDEMKIKLIILDYLNIGVTVELRKFLKLFFEFQKKIEYQSEVKRSVEKKVGRPEVLTHEQQLKVIELFQKGSSVYSIARKFSVARTVIKRVLDKAKDFS